jgi:hypothetical protein
VIRNRNQPVKMRNLPDGRLSLTFRGPRRRDDALVVYFKAHPLPTGWMMREAEEQRLTA